MFHPDQLRQIIRTALQPITATRHPFWSPAAEELLLMISAHESTLGRNLRQFGGGPGRGLCQVEPETMIDNYKNFILSRPDLAGQIEAISGVPGPDLVQLQYNPLYNLIHARLKLYRSPGQLPPAHDLPAMAAYAKQHYNSPLGAATPGKYLLAYHRLILAV